MPRQNVPLHGFNRGIVDQLALARTDLARLQLSAETQTNWMPRKLGSMMLRVGTEYVATTRGMELAKYLDFVFATSDQALIELTEGYMRVFVDDVLLTRPAVSTVITNGNPFAVGLTDWTDADEAGATSSDDAGMMKLVGGTFAYAIRYQAVTIAVPDQNVVNAARIVINRGPVTFKIGTTIGGEEVFSEATLGTGTHSIAFIPGAATIYVQFSKVGEASAYVESIEIESAGALELPTSWDEDDLPYIRKTQSGDILYIACKGQQQRKIERRSNGSWSVVLYQPEDGPFRGINLKPVTIAASATVGDCTLTANSGIFRSTHVGALFRLESIGQSVSADLSGDAQYSDPIRVTGVGDARKFRYIDAGTWSGFVTLQRSFGDVGAWEELFRFASNHNVEYDDGFDNQIVYYRWGFVPGDYVSGIAEVSLEYPSGTITGVARVTAYTSPTSVDATILIPFGSTKATQNWYEGAWSDFRGWPSAVAIYEGRMWWAGKDKNDGSVSDAFESFDDTIEGDSGPISRSIGSGPVDTISWILPLQRMILGGQSAEHSVRSSSFDEPLTPTNYNIKEASTQGSNNVAALRIDSGGVYVQNGDTRLFELSFGSDATYDYTSVEMSLMAPNIGNPGIISIAVQRQPDTRIHCVRSDGVVAVLIYDKIENIRCWILVQMDDPDDKIVDVVVLRGRIEDQVYYVVQNASGCYLVKNALESECQGGTLNKQADMFVKYSGAPITSLPGLDHLEGRTVVVWADGKVRASQTVSGGAIALDGSYSNVIAGLTYTAQYKSSKLAYAAGAGTALSQTKKVSELAAILLNTHASGLRYGSDFDQLDALPLMEEEKVVDPDSIWANYDKNAFEFNGEWDTDSRLCLQAQAPKPCTVLAVIITVETHDRT